MTCNSAVVDSKGPSADVSNPHPLEMGFFNQPLCTRLELDEMVGYSTTTAAAPN